MPMKQGYVAVIVAAVMLPLLVSGCFTGVESTPKITMRDVKRQKVTVTPEQEFAATFRQEPFSSWTHGKKFYVTNRKISYVMSPVEVAERVSEGDTLRYIGTRSVPSLTEAPDTDMLFLTASGDTLGYRLNTTESELRERTSVDVPFTIEMSVVDSARGLLNGHDYYVLSPVWYDRSGNNLPGRKFVKVTVADVVAGNDNYPLCVRFVDDTAKEYGVFMSIGSGRRATRNFDTLFAFDDPRRNYPSVSDATWELITRCDVAPEMTRDECRLALGSPREVTRAHYMERWGYDNGVYLIFDEGYLVRYRK